MLYGDWNPSGRLPYTIAKNANDYPAQVIKGTGIQEVISIPYTEGLEIDYRHFDAVSVPSEYIMRAVELNAYLYSITLNLALNSASE